MISSVSVQPSPSSSKSVSSGLPSPSVSKSDEIIERLNNPEYAELFAHMVYVVALNMVVAIPETTPVELFNSILNGRLGLTSQPVISPPEVNGTSGVKLWLTVIYNSFVGYNIIISASLLVSKESQIPSASESLG